ncbi:metallophosphoesterase family protein [Granulicella mallensis]|uniref:Metallophosphoesterase n=1 Tax=Granulicella mallensis (strain ATCC BAA-1857 / DSM 23137 / MP5ACTX8) TaxID=682795 RepID=G8NUQ8_GRAMM|nr:metallophosphoesterase [Granulicella mallensis]AEU37598.1 metallophosphoesterase [Granulicella mallensis MP5ACTX8]
MRVAAISDTHGRQNWEMPNCDVFIHAGDMTGSGSLQETAAFAARLRKEMESANGPPHAIIVPGNHDECFETLPRATRELFGPNVHVLEDEPLVLDGVTFYGSPWTTPFMLWRFMADESRLAMLYQNMPTSVDILVTHGPPHGILDPGWKVKHAGSMALAKAVADRQVRHHIFGHLHGAGGQLVQQGTRTFITSQRATKNTGLSINLACLKPTTVFEYLPKFHLRVGRIPMMPNACFTNLYSESSLWLQKNRRR